MNNQDTPATAVPAYTPGSTVRIVDDLNKDRTYTVSEVTSVGKAGKQFRCSLVCNQDGTILTGIAPSRLATPYKEARKTFIGGLEFRPEVDDSPVDGHHPAMFVASKLPALLGAELLDLVKESGEKETRKAHLDVVVFAVIHSTATLAPCKPQGFINKLRFGFSYDTPERLQDWLLTVAQVHANLARGASR